MQSMQVRILMRAWMMCALLALGIANATVGNAQSYPNRPVKLIVPQAPGGRDDTIGRVLAQRLGEYWGQSVVVMNRGGAGGTVGAEMASNAAPDGYTLLLGGSNTLGIAPAMTPDLSYKPLTDFVAIGGVARIPYALAVNARMPVHNVVEFVAYARARPGKLNYGSGGNGSTSGLAAELFKAETGIDMVAITYNGIAPALTRLISGDIDVMFADMAALKSQSDVGTLRLIASAGSVRSHLAPDLPTVAEQGVKGVSMDSWCGLFAPADTPSDVLATLSDALRRIMQDPDFRRRLELRGFDPFEQTSSGITAIIESDIQKYTRIIQQAGIKATQ